MRMILMDDSTRMTDVQNRWIFSTETPVSQRGTHNLYDPSKSGTAQPMPSYTWSIKYEDGTTASGNVYQDTVSVGATVITGQAVEVAQQVSAQLVDEPADGILGLALSLNQSMFGLIFV
jgi:aspergillopepsin I